MTKPNCLRAFWAILSLGVIGCREATKRDVTDVSRAEMSEVGTPTVLAESAGMFIAEPVAVAAAASYLFVADAGTGSVLQYDRAGRLIRRIGRRGRGPGEMAAPSAIAAIEDTGLVVADATNRRVQLFDSRSGEYKIVRSLRSNPFTVSVSGTSVLAATFDAMQTNSMYRVSLTDTGSLALGPVTGDYVSNKRTRFAYPFSAAAHAPGGMVVGMVASKWVVRTDEDGRPVDSVALQHRVRRGVPEDLEKQLEQNKAPGGEMLLASMLMALQSKDEMTYFLHADFRPEGPGEAARAFVSVLNWKSHSQCVDAEVPLAPHTRPAFAFRGDTLVVAQNVMSANDSAAVATVRLFHIHRCK